MNSSPQLHPALKKRIPPRFSSSTAMLLLLLFGLPLHAQYNGPVTGADRTNSTTPTVDQATLYPSTPEPLLAPGDQISLHLFGDPDYTFTGRVGTDGAVLLPLIGVVPLQGQSITSAEQLIAAKLETAGMYRNPQVILTLAEGPNATITVGGELHAVVPVVGARSLYAALAAAGGLPSTASRTVTVLRPGLQAPLVVDLGNDPIHSAAANIPLFPGDTVIVSRIGVVYVSGEFRNPGVVPLTNFGPLTLTQVSAIVGGPVYDAKYSELHIIRTVADRRTVTTVNIKDILYGKAPDPIMQPNDIVFLPPSFLKSSLSNGTLGSILGILSFAVATVYATR